MERMFLFPCPLFRFDYSGAFNEQRQLVDAIKKIENEDTSDISLKYTHGSYTSFYSENNIFDRAEFKHLKNFIERAVQEVHALCGLGDKLKFSCSWANVNRKYSYHEAHHHCPNIWSGVYYVQTQESDATISFINSNILNSSWPYNAKKLYNNDLNSSQTVCKTQTGMLLIFPSYLQHKVDQQMGDNERISIAFNMDLE